MIGENGCQDVATSLVMQGIDASISIPIYDIFYLTIKPANHAQFLCDSIQEFSMIRNLARNCGAVACTINILDIDILTLGGVLCIYTPNTGMNVFFKLGNIIVENLPDDIINEIVYLSGITIPEGVISFTLEFVMDAIQSLLDRLIDIMSNNLEEYNINLLHWEELPEYYNIIKESGEMIMMLQYRQGTGAVIL